jgi:hypothetical protein
MRKQMFHLVRSTFTGLLLISAVLLSAGICAAFYDSSGNYYPDDSAASQSADRGIEKALGSSTYQGMMRGINQNAGYVPSYSTGNSVNNWMVANRGTASTTGPYNWMQPYLGPQTTGYLNSNRYNPQPYWANADTSTMSPYFASRYPQMKASAEYWHNKRWSNLGHY